MLREPAELRIDEHGRVEIPLGLLAEAGMSPGIGVVAFSEGDGRIVLRRADDAVRDLVEKGRL
jgi:bifunctional DNA-binding transcriptional regulator/antitoxin component of YhaV-PrlF toxin-antitoxin module